LTEIPISLNRPGMRQLTFGASKGINVQQISWELYYFWPPITVIS
jgi:hypothetical protein